MIKVSAPVITMSLQTALIDVRSTRPWVNTPLPRLEAPSVDVEDAEAQEARDNLGYST